MRATKIFLGSSIALLISIPTGIYLNHYQWFSKGEAMVVAMVIYFLVYNTLILSDIHDTIEYWRSNK